MISLCALAGISVGGCYRPSGFPPPGAIPGTPTRSLPSAARVRSYRSEGIGVQGRYNESTDPGPAQFAWEPNATAREWNSIVIHHTAASHGSVESIHETHLQRKDASGNPWQGIGYHFVIGNGSGMGDGEVEPTFRWREQMHGAHAGSRDYNQHGIGIALVGNFDETPPTAAQMTAVKQLISSLKERYGIPSDQVIGHGDIKATECPGKYFPMAEVSQGYSERVFGHRDSGRVDASLVAQKRSSKR